MSLDFLNQPPPVVHRRGFLAAFLGAPGVGKSSLAAQFPSPEVVCDARDQGMLDLASEGLLPFGPDKVNVCDSYDKYVQTLEAVVAGSCQTVICESILGIQHLCHQLTSKKDYEDDYSGKKFYNYQNGPRTAAERYFQVIIDLLLKAQNKGKHGILVGHLSPKTEETRKGHTVLIDKIMSSTATMERIQVSFTNIFCFITEARLENVRGNVNRANGFTRLCYPQENPIYPSKNRMGLSVEFELPDNVHQAYLTFMSAIKRNPKTGFRQ